MEAMRWLRLRAEVRAWSEPDKSVLYKRNGKPAMRRSGALEDDRRQTQSTRVCPRRRRGGGGRRGASRPPLLAQDQAQAWEQAVRKILGDAKPSDGKVAIELPEIAENGNTVPFTVSVDSPMTEKDHVKAIHVIATANPQPGVATFRFTPLSGKAAVAEPHAPRAHAGRDRHRRAERRPVPDDQAPRQGDDRRLRRLGRRERT